MKEYPCPRCGDCSEKHDLDSYPNGTCNKCDFRINETFFVWKQLGYKIFSRRDGSGTSLYKKKSEGIYELKANNKLSFFISPYVSDDELKVYLIFR